VIPRSSAICRRMAFAASRTSNSTFKIDHGTHQAAGERSDEVFGHAV
jgi:hypothetical protein